MRKVNIVLGCPGVGKSSYAKEYSQRSGCMYIDVGKLIHARTQSDPIEEISRLMFDKDIFELILDGMNLGFSKNPNRDYEILSYLYSNKLKIVFHILFAPAWMLVAQYREKKGDDLEDWHNEDFIQSAYHSIEERIKRKEFKGEIRFFDATDFENVQYDIEEFKKKFYELNRLHSKEDTQAFLDSLSEKYQTIELPYGINRIGNNRDVEKWRSMCKAIDFEGRTVLDLGGYFGYYCFKAKEAGAREVVLWDLLSNLDTVRELRNRKRSNIVIQRVDISETAVPKTYDIILLLNVLHHLRNPFGVLKQMFSHSKIAVVLFELPLEYPVLSRRILRKLPVVELGRDVEYLSQCGKGRMFRFSEPMIKMIAEENGHRFSKKLECPHTDRAFLVFKKY